MIRIMKYGETPNSELFLRSQSAKDVSAAVAEIIANVRENGDRALFDYAERYDHAKLTSLEVSPDEFEAARAAVDDGFLDILERAAANIRAFHEKQLRAGFIRKQVAGVYAYLPLGARTLRKIENIKDAYTDKFSEILVTAQNEVAINSIPMEYINARVAK